MVTFRRDLWVGGEGPCVRPRRVLARRIAVGFLLGLCKTTSTYIKTTTSPFTSYIYLSSPDEFARGIEALKLLQGKIYEKFPPTVKLQRRLANATEIMLPVKFLTCNGAGGGARPRWAERLASRVRATMRWSWCAATATSRLSNSWRQCWCTIHLWTPPIVPTFWHC